MQKTMSKILLDGYGINLKSIRGIPDNTCPDTKNGYREIVIETDKGQFIIWGCSHCHVLSGMWKKSEFASSSEGL